MSERAEQNQIQRVLEYYYRHKSVIQKSAHISFLINNPKNLLQYLEKYDKIQYDFCIYVMISGGFCMAVSYNRLWKLLVDKKMSKADLRKAAELAPNTMTKLRRG